MWTQFVLTMTFLNELCATMPADPQLWAGILEARKPTRRPPDTKSIQEIAEELLQTMPTPDEEGPTISVFQRSNGHLVVGTRTIRAHLKDCARVISSLYVGRIQGEKSFAVR